MTFVPGDPQVEPVAWGPALNQGPCFVVGNGPSLRADDLTEIMCAGYPSWATNYIHLLYDQTSWRPDYWVATEILDTRWAAWHTFQGYDCYLTANRMDKLEKFRHALRTMGNENVHYLPVCDHHWRRHDSPDRPKKLHLPGICLYGSSGSTAIQLAILFGYSPVILTGFDASLQALEKDAPDLNHFDLSYGSTAEQAITPGLAQRWTLTWHDSHRQIAEAARELGVRIVNASRETALECYERDDLAHYV